MAEIRCRLVGSSFVEYSLKEPGRRESVSFLGVVTSQIRGQTGQRTALVEERHRQRAIKSYPNFAAGLITSARTPPDSSSP